MGKLKVETTDETRVRYHHECKPRGVKSWLLWRGYERLEDATRSVLVSDRANGFHRIVKVTTVMTTRTFSRRKGVISETTTVETREVVS